MQRIDKVIENGTTWFSKNRVSPMFAKERMNSHAHHAKSIRSGGNRGQTSTSINAKSDISRNEAIGNLKSATFKPVKALNNHSPFKQNNIKIEDLSDKRSFKS